MKELMVLTNPDETETRYDRKSEIKAFDESKTGVKGLVDAGVQKVPKIFIHENNDLEDGCSHGDSTISIPVINMEGMDDHGSLRNEIAKKIGEASEKWGFFQVVNHGISTNTLDALLEGIYKFHEQDDELKKQLYTRDGSRSLVYNSNFNLYQSSAANWRDSIYCTMAPNPPNPQDLPQVCR